MLTEEQNETLTRVGPGTPMGELMRRYWAPALFSWEISEPDSPPVTIKLLGEELVAFRQTDGKVGVVGARCAHRRAHMFWGRNEENGLRCVYHGWKFDSEGRCIDMPSEPEESNFNEKVQIPAYPTYEVGGVVWCYMGPPERKPAPPLFPVMQVAPERRAMSKAWQQCNWLQALEGGIDTVHVNFLHGGRPPGMRYDENDPRGRANNVSTSARLEVVPTNYGYIYAGIRNMGAEGTNHIRAQHWIMPWHSLRQVGAGPYFSGHMWVPMDDENTMVYNWDFLPDNRPDTARRLVADDDLAIWFRDHRLSIGFGNAFGPDVDPENNFRSVRNADNKYEIDRLVQKTHTYTGIEGGNTQDRAIQESMGAIADRTLERLGTTDRAIITSRRMLLKAVQTVLDGGDPPGAAPTYYNLRGVERILPKGVYWYDDMKAELHGAEIPTWAAPAGGRGRAGGD